MPRGHSLTLNQIVELADHIVLAEYQCELKESLTCGFSVVETIKGEEKESVSPIHWMRNAYYAVRNDTVRPPEDFNSHKSEEFWNMEAERAHFPNGACTPNFTFEPGSTYLLFLDFPANPYAAELILSDQDAWLEYVRRRVPENA